jgi:phosphate transport system permease protein
VPAELREASLALGVPRWRTVFRIIVPAAASGLVTALMLAVARAAGETAPLLFTSFGNRFVTGWTDFDQPDSALPLLIFRDARSAYEPARQRAWAGALVLIGLVLVFTIVARTVTSRRGAVTA